MLSIGIDLGGTWMRAAAVDADRRILAQTRIQTPGEVDVHVLLEWMADAVHELKTAAQSKVCGMPLAPVAGLALPGPVDRDRGVLIRSVNLPGLQGVSIGEAWHRLTGGCVTLMTDADAATWGEFCEAGAAARRFVHVRVGTGVGCAAVIDGALQPGDPRRTTHLEWLVVDRSPGAQRCPCGLRGCLEIVVGGANFRRRAAAAGFSDANSLTAGWAAHDHRAVDLVREFAQALSEAVVRVAVHFDADTMILGGGLLHAVPCLAEETLSLLQQCAAMQGFREFEVRLDRLGDDAGVIGAALIARTTLAV